MFTKEHYVEIAKVLRKTKGNIKPIQISIFHSTIVWAFVNLLKDDNPKFNENKFLDSIYGKEEKS